MRNGLNYRGIVIAMNYEYWMPSGDVVLHRWVDICINVIIVAKSITDTTPVATDTAHNVKTRIRNGGSCPDLNNSSMCHTTMWYLRCLITSMHCVWLIRGRCMRCCFAAHGRPSMTLGGITNTSVLNWVLPWYYTLGDQT